MQHQTLPSKNTHQKTPSCLEIKEVLFLGTSSHPLGASMRTVSLEQYLRLLRRPSREHECVCNPPACNFVLLWAWLGKALPEANVAFPLLICNPGGLLAVSLRQLVPDVRSAIADDPVQFPHRHIRLLQHQTEL